MEIVSKTCSTCKKLTPASDFYKCKTNKDGLYHECKNCKKLYDKNRNLKNPNIRKNLNLQNRYGISIKDKQKMIENQKGKCAICNCILDNGKHTCIDHCHKTGKIRKILCKSCNVLIGHSKENINVLKNAIQYLKIHN